MSEQILDAEDLTAGEDGSWAVIFACENSALRAWERLSASGWRTGDRVQIYRVPCSGKVDEALVLKAMEGGARGVLVLGCPQDSCRFLHGSSRAEKRCRRAASLLGEIPGFCGTVEYASVAGISPRRLKEVVEAFLEGLRGKGDSAEEGGESRT